MPEEISLTMDGLNLSVPEGTTILKAAESIGIEIPTICFHEYCTPNALCRLCVVEVEGARVLTPACIAQVSQGMVIHTRSERVMLSRRTILEMLASAVDLSEAGEIQEFMVEYGTSPSRFPEAAPRSPSVIDDNPMYIRDYAKCVLCWRCVQVCAEDAQYTYAIHYSGRGYETSISTFFETPMPESTCVFCGQCVGVCPTGALKSRRAWLLQQGLEPEEIIQKTRIEKKKKRSP